MYNAHPHFDCQFDKLFDKMIKNTKFLGGYQVEKVHSRHFFFAVRLPQEIKYEIQKKCQSIEEYFPFKNWVHHEDYHITLAFLGSAPVDKLKSAQNLVKSALKEEKGFQLHMNEIGIFGAEESPRIFWADVQKEEKLSLLREKVYMACAEAGFALETRPFRPHITLARRWIGAKDFQRSLLKDQNPYQSHSLTFPVSEVVLYENTCR